MSTQAQPDSLTVIIPAFNEAQSIKAVLENVRNVCGDTVSEIIVVDDGSTDGTYEQAELSGVRVVSHTRNRGYGASLKTGIRMVTTEYVLTMDADGQHRAEDAINLWDQRDGYDMIVGQRTSMLHSPLWRVPGKWVLTRIANLMVKQQIPDLNSGLRLFRRDTVIRYLHLCPSGFSFSTTITLAILSRGYSVRYVPIQVNKRQGKSTVKLVTGFDTVILILRMIALFNPLRIFLPLSMLLVVTGGVWGIPYVLHGSGISVGALLTFTTAILIFCLGILCDQISQLRLERFE